MTGAVELGATVAVNCCKAPRSKVLLVGERVTLMGVGNAEELLLPPHPTRAPRNKDRDKTANTPKTNRRMHPPRPAGPNGLADESLSMLENDQCRGQP